ncbi:MAG TPA: hypothetical protein PLV83_04245, partial [Bacilli bacterium]|nr:hypothetical protein [Bacilli bacterium]
NEFREMIKGTDLEQNLKSISLLTESEYLKYNGANSYLDTRTSMWLKDSNGVLKVVTKEGNVSNGSNSELYGVRPVVVISNSFVTGTGTYDNMYKIIMDTNTKDINNLKNGDFIKLNNKYTVRVIDNKNLKVVLHGILNKQEGFYNYKYKDSNIERYLVNTFANESGIKEYIDKSDHSFYNGYYNAGDNYANVKASSYTGFIALPTIGELFSGSDLFIQIQNTNNVVSYLPSLANQTNNQWLLTPNSQGNYEIGYNGLEKITNNNAYGIRPVFYLKNDLVIKSGDGSPRNPYILN